MSDADDEVPPPIERVPWWRVAHVVGVLLLIAILVPFIVYIFPQAIGGNGSYVVLSSSMEPTMSPGDVIITSDVDPSEIETRDIITFASSGDRRPTTHRVVDVTETDGTLAFRTAGDANENTDRRLVTPGDIRGEVMTVGGVLLVIPLIGYVIEFANTQLGFVALFAVPLVLLVASEIWNIVVASRSGESEESKPETSSVAAETQQTEAEDDGAEPEATTELREDEVDTEEGDAASPGVRDETEPAETGNGRALSAAEIADMTTESESSEAPEGESEASADAASMTADASGTSETTEMAAESKSPEKATASPQQADTASEPTPSGEGKSAPETPESGDDASTDEAGVTFTTAELQLGLIVMTLFFGYSAWVSYVTFEVWSFAVTGAVATATILLIVLYFFGGGSGDTQSASTASDDSGETTTGAETSQDVEQEIVLLKELKRTKSATADGGNGFVTAAETAETRETDAERQASADSSSKSSPEVESGADREV